MDPDVVAAQSPCRPVAGQVILEVRGHDLHEHGFRRQLALKQPVRSRQLGGRLDPAAGAARLSGQSSAGRNDRTTEDRTVPGRSIWRARQHTVLSDLRTDEAAGENAIERSREYAGMGCFGHKQWDGRLLPSASWLRVSATPLQGRWPLAAVSEP